MRRGTKRLAEFRKWFDRFILKGFGKKCPDFTWDCYACRAHFVMVILDDFVDDTVATEKWISRERK